MTLEIVSILSRLISIVLGILAITFSLWFYRQTKDTEKEVSNSLIKIETQTDMLHKITGRQLDLLTKFVTEPKKDHADEHLKGMFEIIAQLPQMLSPQQISQNTLADNQYQIQIWVAIYFYSAQTNWLSAPNLPDQVEFNTNDPYHAHIKRIVDLSAADFKKAATVLSGFSDAELKSSNTYHILEETLTV